MLEDLIYTLGGPYLFTLFLSCVMVTMALMLSVARMKLVGNDDYSRPTTTPRALHVEKSFPFLESLSEVIKYFLSPLPQHRTRTFTSVAGPQEL
jgi:hypothetical protein